MTLEAKEQKEKLFLASAGVRGGGKPLSLAMLGQALSCALPCNSRSKFSTLIKHINEVIKMLFIRIYRHISFAECRF